MKTKQKQEKWQDIFEAKIKNMKDLMIDKIEHDYDKLICDLNMERGLKTERIKK